MHNIRTHPFYFWHTLYTQTHFFNGRTYKPTLLPLFRSFQTHPFWSVGCTLCLLKFLHRNFCFFYLHSCYICFCLHFMLSINPNTTRSHQISQKLSPKHAAHGVAQSTYPNYRHGKAGLSKQPHWRAAGDPRLARGRSRVRAPGPAGALRALFSPPSLPSSFRR